MNRCQKTTVNAVFELISLFVFADSNIFRQHSPAHLLKWVTLVSKLLTQNAKTTIAAAVAPTEYINPEYASARVKVYFLAYLVTALLVEETVPLINVPIKGLPV